MRTARARQGLAQPSHRGSRLLLLAGIVFLFVIRSGNLRSLSALAVIFICQAALIVELGRADSYVFGWVFVCLGATFWVGAWSLPRLWRRYHLRTLAQLRQRRG